MRCTGVSSTAPLYQRTFPKDVYSEKPKHFILVKAT